MELQIEWEKHHIEFDDASCEEVYDWLRENATGRFSVGRYGRRSGVVNIETETDAVAFKIVWS